MSNQIKLFDSHCHLDFPKFKGKVDAMVSKCEETGIGGILIPGVTREGWRRLRQISARYAICHSALGLHPMFMKEHKKSHLRDLEMALSVGPIAAIGEIGLDFYHGRSEQSEQIEFFESQVIIAKTANLPIVMHIRKAHDEVLQILKRLNFKNGGIVHAFNGSENQAERFIDNGFKLGFGGAMTYPRAAKLHKLVQNLPLASIVLETDAPDMPPVTCKLDYNTPLHLFDNFRSFISLREESPAVIAKQTTENVYAVLNIEVQ